MKNKTFEFAKRAALIWAVGLAAAAPVQAQSDATTPATDDPAAAIPPTNATEQPEAPAGAADTLEGVVPDVPVNDPSATQMAQSAVDSASEFLMDGGPAIWAIAALSVFTLALILWKIWRLALIGAWSRGRANDAVEAYERGDMQGALNMVRGRIGVRSKVVDAAMRAIATYPETQAREETARVAKREIASARVGLGALELIASIAPLLGLLGTVLGMIAAFQALQAAGSRADPALLAGGIWEALLTTAAGMAVAIPASAALTWFDAVIDRIRRDVEDHATRLFVAQPVAVPMAKAAE